MRTIAITILSVSLAVVFAGPAKADVTTNLLTNPGAETGDLTGWTVGGTSNPGVDSGTFDPGINPHTGSFDFFGHTGASGTLTQAVTLVGNQGITAAAIDSGTAQATVGFFEQGLGQGTPSDDAFISLSYLNATNGVISTVSTPTDDSHNGTWTFSSTTFAVPVGTRTIDYTMNFVRNSGSDLDAFVDDNSLQIVTAVSAVPEPSPLVLGTLLTTGAGLFSLYRRRVAIV